MMTIRQGVPEDELFLKEMTYQAIYLPKGAGLLPRKILEEPAIRRYYADFGKEGDAAFVAMADQEAVGAVWIRFATAAEKGYGFVHEEVPELTIAVLPKFRGRGIGSLAFGTHVSLFADGRHSGCVLECGAVQSSAEALRAVRISGREKETKFLHDVAGIKITIQ